MSNKSRTSHSRGVGLLLPVIALFVIACDQASKYWIAHRSGLVEGAYPPFGGFEIVHGFFSIVYTTNTGAAWGMFSGFGIILIGLGVAALAGIYFFRHELGLEKRSMRIVFGLMSGGIVGNLLDRMIYGRVTDFLDFVIGSYRWPTFNIADSAMVVAACLYIAIGFFAPEGKTPVTEGPTPADKKQG
jgi:signal peptidase II